MKRLLFLAWFSAICMFTVSMAHADVLDPYDNINAPPGAFALGTYWNYLHYPEYSIKDGPDIDIGVDATVLAIRPVYFFPEKLFGKMSWGANAILPLGHVSALGAESTSGIGDLIFGPFIFLIEDDTNNIYLSFWEFIQAPTGQFSRDRDINMGTGRWFFEQELAFGWYPGKFGIDANLNWWIFNSSKDTNVKPPQALELEAVFHYGITDKFRVGIQGAAWWDLGDYEFNDVKAKDSKGTNYKLGFNLGYNLQENLILNLRFMQDVKSDNWTKGSCTYLRVLYLF